LVTEITGMLPVLLDAERASHGIPPAKLHRSRSNRSTWRRLGIKQAVGWQRLVARGAISSGGTHGSGDGFASSYRHSESQTRSSSPWLPCGCRA
jgi:hypothetical protein